MAQQKFCQNCIEKNNCQEVFQHLGHIQGHSVVLEVIVAFLLPLVVFIVSLAIYERILAEPVNAKHLQTPLAFLLALLTTCTCILITRAIHKQPGKNK